MIFNTSNYLPNLWWCCIDEIFHCLPSSVFLWLIGFKVCIQSCITHPLVRFVTSDPTISRSQVHGCPPVVTSLVDIDLVIFVKMLQHFLVTIHGRAVERGIILSSIQIIDKLKGVTYNLPCHRVILAAISWTFSCLFVGPWFSVFQFPHSDNN